MSSEDQYSFYKHFENLKNRVYRQLSNAREGQLFIPSFYYNWFYVSERQLYNNLCKRQSLGLSISDKEVEEYNKIKQNFRPYSVYSIKKKTSSTEEGVNFDEVYLKTKHLPYLPMISLGLVSYYYLYLSKYWLLFMPVIAIGVISYKNRKFAPQEEIESFYNYVNERRNANLLYSKYENTIQNLENKEGIETIRKELSLSNKSLEEAMNDLYYLYFIEASKSSKS